MNTEIIPVGPGEGDQQRETSAALYGVALLGSFMHAAPRSEDTAELAVGGLAALAPGRLVAVAWYSDRSDLLPHVLGRYTNAETIPGPLADFLARYCAGLPVSRPSRHDGGQLPARLRVAGIQSLLAVPLRVSTECLGFLIVADPEPRFAEDLTLIQVLGAQASTALFVARMRESEAAHVSELDTLTQELRDQGDLLSRALRLQRELIDLVLDGRAVSTIVEHLAAQLNAAVWLLDHDARVLAHSPGEAPGPPLPGPEDLQRAIAEQRRLRDLLPVEISTASDCPPVFMQSVATDSEVFGYLVVRSADLGQFGQTVLQGGRLVLALRLLIDRSVAEAEERAGRDLIQDALLLGRRGHRSAALAARLGYDEDGPAIVMAVRMGSPQTAGLGTETARRRAWREVRDQVGATTGGLVGVIGGEIVAIMRPEAAEVCGRRIIDRLASSFPGARPAIGVSDQRPGLDDLEASYREALTAAAVSERIGTEILRFGDLGLYRLFFDAQHADRIEEHIERWLGPLLRYDTRHHTELVDTLAAHLAGTSREEVAARLYIHPSTLKYRLRRIREIFSPDFADAESRFNIELALRLVQMRRYIRAPGGNEGVQR
jgi:DNA-binding PucR family transcriptional regulator